VIGITEALVAIDVNSGRATKEGSIEDTALKTNLEAAEEVARQLRLRDLAGLIVIDFIDMEERRNNAAVEKRLKDKLKTDRARIQVGRISGFGLMEMSRQRLRPGMLESTTQPCSHCHGTGLIRSDDSLGLQVLRALEEEGTRKRSKEVLLRAPIGIVNFLINGKREHIALIEARYGMSVRIECDPTMISPDFSIEKFKTATRVVPEVSSVISGNASLMGAPVAEEEDEDIIDDVDEVEEAEVTEVAASAAPAAAAGEGGTKKRRRRRRRKKPGQPGEAVVGSDAEGDDGEEEDGDDEAGSDAGQDAPTALTEAVAEAPVAAEAEVAVKKPTRTRAPRGSKSAAAQAEAAVVAEAPVDAPEAEAATKPTRSRSRSRTAKAGPVAAVEVPAVEAASEPPVAAEEKPKPTRSRSSRSKPKAEAAAEAVVSEPAAAVEAAPVVEAPVVQAEPVPAAPVAVEPAEEDGPPKPKKRGWWSLGR
jgi:ribonuclease E